MLSLTLLAVLLELNMLLECQALLCRIYFSLFISPYKCEVPANKTPIPLISSTLQVLVAYLYHFTARSRPKCHKTNALFSHLFHACCSSSSWSLALLVIKHFSLESLMFMHELSWQKNNEADIKVLMVLSQLSFSYIYFH